MVVEAEANRGLGHRASPSARQDEVAFLAVAWGPGGPACPLAASAALGWDRVSWGGTVQAVLGGRRSRPRAGV